MWISFKGRALKSKSLDGLALFKGQITTIHQQNMYSWLYRVQNLEFLTAKLIYLMHGNIQKETETEIEKVFS